MRLEKKINGNNSCVVTTLILTQVSPPTYSCLPLGCCVSTMAAIFDSFSCCSADFGCVVVYDLYSMTAENKIEQNIQVFAVESLNTTVGQFSMSKFHIKSQEPTLRCLLIFKFYFFSPPPPI